jgi:hypothetical protein
MAVSSKIRTMVVVFGRYSGYLIVLNKLVAIGGGSTKV